MCWTIHSIIAPELLLEPNYYHKKTATSSVAVVHFYKNELVTFE